MANVQRGDNRQYITQGVAEQSYTGELANAINGGLQAGVSIAQKANESTLANNQIDLSTKFLAKNNEINTKYQADPTNPQREIELQQAFDSLSNQYKINPVCQKQWTDIKNSVYGRYKMYNAQWVEKQQQSNIQTNLQNGYENLTNQISMLGLNGASIDEMRLIYANGIEGLRNGAIAGLGEITVDNFLKDSNHDIMTTYISALAQNNPVEAQKLLQDEGVRNDIGRAETLEKLDKYVMSSLANQSKKAAVGELCNTLRNMNSEESQRILNGQADLNSVMKFIESNRNLPEGSKDLILGIYGLGSTTEYVYDRDKKRIMKKEDARSGSGGSSSGIVGIRKMSDADKKATAIALENDLHKLISFSLDGENVNNVKDIKKNKLQKQATEGIITYVNNVAQMQERIDSACAAGAITKDERKRMLNDYIAPVTEYLESSLGQLDESNWKREKLGYDRISKAFPLEENGKKLTGEKLHSMERQKLFAQNYYLDELGKAAKRLGLKNIYDIETMLKSGQQQEVYKMAADNALMRAKRWTDEPEIFFAKEYPDIAAQPSLYFKANQAKLVNRAVAEAVFKREFENADGTSKLDLKDYATVKCREEIQKTYRDNRIKAGGILDLKETQMYISNPAPKNLNEFYQRVKALGTTPEKFMQEARERGFLKTNTKLKDALKDAHKKITGQYNYMQGYYNALQEAEYAKALKERNKK